jgi:hypothetical protein
MGNQAGQEKTEFGLKLPLERGKGVGERENPGKLA